MRWLVAVALGLLMSASAWAEDWGARRDPFDPSVVARYKAILERDPHDEGALRQLIAMYKRHRTIAKLETEYRAQLDAGEQWPALVVLARLPSLASGESTMLWKRAVAAKPDDVRGWLAVGDAARTDAAAARDAYQRAAQLATASRDKRLALTKLIGAAGTTGDARVVDEAYAQLIALAPKDGMLWLDRGNAQLGAKQFAAAHDSFATAEGLLRTDPERKLTAIVNQGIAIEAQGRSDDAIAQYERALDKVPPGYFLAQEIVTRIVDTERKRKRVDAAIERLEKRWPERRRRHFEWSTLGDLYKETRSEDRAIDAYQRAVAKAPTEVVTQRKLIALLDKLRPAAALAQHEAAARVAPGDADLQLELAKRYRAGSPAKANATLVALARRLNSNVNVRSTIAKLYEEWNDLPRAIGEYEAIVVIEPKDPEHAVTLGDAYWRSGKQERARAAWQRLDTIGTADSLFRHGEVLARHDMWNDAVAAYSMSIDIDGANPDALYGRARAYEALASLREAAEDARRAIALTANATHADGLRNRQLLVRVLGRSYNIGDIRALSMAVARWRFAFERGDITAGYMLAAHHGRLRSHQQHDVLVQLYKRVPTDDSLGIALSRSYVHRREFDRARHELEVIAKRTPARAEEMTKLIAHVEEDRERAERDIRLEEEGSRARSGNPDIVGRRRRFGLRFEVGSDVQHTTSALVGMGLYRTHRLAGGTTAGWRFDWTQRDDVMQEHRAIALAGNIARRILDLRKVEIAAGLGPRFELRYGQHVPSATWGRAALGGDVTLEVLPRALPATLGVRFHHSFTDDVRSSTVLVELGFEVR
jgi:tetratricopeptide (TPR) repeat protein